MSRMGGWRRARRVAASMSMVRALGAFGGCTAVEVWSTSSHAQTFPEAPWDAPLVRVSPPPAPSLALGPLSEALTSSIRFYQREIGPNSIARCPYAVSCSNFALRVTRDYGFFGLPLFLDRYFFRENGEIPRHYPRVRLAGGVVRFDDSLRDAAGQGPAVAVPPPASSGVYGSPAPPSPSPSPSSGETSNVDRIQALSRFAEALSREGDHYRAITAWKEARYLATPKDRAIYSLQIARAYRAGRRYEALLSASSDVLVDPLATSGQRTDAALLQALGYLELHMPALAARSLEATPRVTDAPGVNGAPGMNDVPGMNGAPGMNGVPDARYVLLRGVVDLEAEQYATAAAGFASVEVDPRAGPAVRMAATDLRLRALRADDMPSRSPLLAGVLSAVFPGSGQAYSGHWVDAAQALFFVGAFAFTSGVAYAYETQGDRPYVLTAVSLSLTGIFHIANIWGAARTAQLYNQRQRDLFLESVHERLERTPLP
jgi:hypothetical protein